jgi:polysaccharide export outer membrane protein
MQHDGYPRLWSRIFVLLLAAFGAAALAGCAGTRGGPVPYEPTNFGRPDVESVAPNVADGPQRIGALDKLKVSVFQVPELSGDFQVDSAGSIEFPLIGAVTVIGKTAEEVRQTLTARLGDRYLSNPNVQVALTEQTEQAITVDGSVRNPGVFPVKGTTTLMQAIALAKGTAEDANIRRVIVFRTIKGERMAGAFDLQDIRRAKAKDPLIYGNDIVIVDGSRAQKVFKELLATLPLLSVLRPY